MLKIENTQRLSLKESFKQNIKSIRSKQKRKEKNPLESWTTRSNPINTNVSSVAGTDSPSYVLWIFWDTCSAEESERGEQEEKVVLMRVATRTSFQTAWWMGRTRVFFARWTLAFRPNGRGPSAPASAPMIIPLSLSSQERERETC